MPKTIVIDKHAYNILQWAKKQCEKEGIEKPDLSEAIRYMHRMLLEKGIK